MDDLSCFKPSKLLHSQERMTLYRVGGFHPVKLGDTFKNGRYKVHHKLGWGGSSTVWLARDESADRWVALKIPVAKSTSAARELVNHQKVREARAANGIVSLLDSFVHKGPNGNHQCLVFEVLGRPVETVILDWVGGGDCLQSEITIAMTRHLLKTLSAMHRAGYAHGDVSAANMAFTTSELDGKSPDLVAMLGIPRTEQVARVDGKPLDAGIPEQLIKKTLWNSWINEDLKDVRLIGLGQAFPSAKPPAKLVEPKGLQAPEGIFTGKFDHRVDLWRAGCTIYFLVTASNPFPVRDDIDAQVGQMIHFVEGLPAEWLPEWERMKQKSGRQFKDIPEKMPAKSKLESRLAKHTGDPALRILLPVIQGLMRFRPRDRISADEALLLLDGKTLEPALQVRPKTTSTPAKTTAVTATATTTSGVMSAPKTTSTARATPAPKTTPSKAPPSQPTLSKTTVSKATTSQATASKATTSKAGASQTTPAKTTPAKTAPVSKAAPAPKTAPKQTSKPTTTQTAPKQTGKTAGKATTTQTNKAKAGAGGSVEK